jgi:hypothetical protein
MFSLNPILAEGRETRPNSRPVATAKPRTPTNASSDATTFAAVPLGVMLPYPTVLSVWELKKKALRKRPHPPQRGRELLGQTGIESGFPHMDEIIAGGGEMRLITLAETPRGGAPGTKSERQRPPR